MFLTVLLPLLMLLLDSITSRFSGNGPLLLTRKVKSEKPTLRYFRRLFVVVVVVVRFSVCLFVILFGFLFFVFCFFSQCRKLRINLSKEQRAPVRQSFTTKYNIHFYLLAVEWTWYNTIFICTHSCSKIQYNDENIKSKKLEYWLPGISMGASKARQPVDISIK